MGQARTRGHWVWRRASILAQSHILASCSLGPDLPSARWAGERAAFPILPTWPTPQHYRYMRRFIPRNRGRFAGRSSSPRVGCFPPFPSCRPFPEFGLSHVVRRWTISAAAASRNQESIPLATAQRTGILQQRRTIMNGTNGTNGGDHSRNGTNGVNGVNGVNGTNESTAQAFVGAIDQGTTSSRFLIFNQRGEVVVTHQIEFTQIYPQPG
jgi:hypothetical protein